jgi:hypothetical protein
MYLQHKQVWLLLDKENVNVNDWNNIKGPITLIQCRLLRQVLSLARGTSRMVSGIDVMRCSWHINGVVRL